MATPICKIAQETGEVPIECLFKCQRDCPLGTELRDTLRTPRGRDGHVVQPLDALPEDDE